jgi:hypothetical protein
MEDLLRRAKEGEMRGFAMTFIRGNGRPRNRVISGDANPYVLMAGAALLAHDLSGIFYASEVAEGPDEGPG